MKTKATYLKILNFNIPYKSGKGCHIFFRGYFYIVDIVLQKIYFIT